jgi:hypothetical protein
MLCYPTTTTTRVMCLKIVTRAPVVAVLAVPRTALNLQTIEEQANTHEFDRRWGSDTSIRVVQPTHAFTRK